MACPSSGSTGLVNAVPVLWVGTSSRQNRVFGEDIAGVAGDRGSLVLPADAADPQPRDLIAAQAGEQPGQGHCPDELDRVDQRAAVGRHVLRCEVEPGPQQLGPHLVGDHPGIGAEQGTDASGDGQNTGGVEPARDPLPFLAVAEERAAGHQHVGLCGRQQRRADAAAQGLGALHVVAGPHPVDRRHPRGAGLSGPLAWLGDIGMFGGQPPAGLGQVRADEGADLRGQRRGVIPALNVSGPLRGGAGDLGQARVADAHGWVAEAQGCDGLLNGEQATGLPARRARVGAEPGQHVGAQVLEQRTAVVQQQLAQHRGQLVAAAAGMDLIAPSGEDAGDLAHRVVHDLLTEDLVAQLAAVEPAEPAEAVEAGQQVAEGHHVRPDLAVRPARSVTLELPGGGSGQAQPPIGRPAPVRRPGLGAASQDQRDRVVRRAPVSPACGQPQ